MDIVEQLIRDEGLRLMLYTDTVGKVSIGVGRNLTDVGISKSEAMVMLQEDLGRTDLWLSLHMPWALQLPDARRGAMRNLAFNLRSRLLQFDNFLEAIKREDWATAKAALLKSLWAKQVGDRATRLADQIFTNVWQ